LREPRAGRNVPGATTNSSANSADRTAELASVATPQPSSGSLSGGAESSLFSSFFMSGKTQDHFRPLTPQERLKLYAKDFLSPFHILMAGASAGISQLQNVPPEWGQGGAGYGRRFANYYAYATTSSVLRLAGEDLLHEDNLYYGSGEQGVWRRVKYALKSSILARGPTARSTFRFRRLAEQPGRRLSPVFGSLHRTTRLPTARKVSASPWRPMQESMSCASFCRISHAIFSAGVQPSEAPHKCTAVGSCSPATVTAGTIPAGSPARPFCEFHNFCIKRALPYDA
jgi:hypothetical protein